MCILNAATGKFAYTERSRKPAVPSKADQPQVKRNNKNFITENALQNILAGTIAATAIMPYALLCHTMH